MIIFSPARSGRTNQTKDTYNNVKSVPEVVINLVNYSIVHQMSLASSPYEPGVSEFVKAGFTPLDSETIQPKRVKESPVQLECKVNDIVELGNEGGFSLFYNNAEAEKKRKFWGPTKTGRPAMLGILAKLAANRPHKIGLLTHERTNVHDEQSFKKLMKLFYVILKRKYSKNPVLLRKLVATGDRYLLEFSRSARREANNGRPPLWSGLIQDGRLYGHNFMGRLHMAIRDEIKKTISKRAA